MNENELRHYFGTDSKFDIQHYEIVNIPPIRDNRTIIPILSDLNLKFIAFKNEIELELRPNVNLISPFLKIVKKSNGKDVKIDVYDFPANCHYVHFDAKSSAALSNCDGNDFNGIILLSNSSFELKSLNNRLKYILKNNKNMASADNRNVPHIIKRVNLPNDETAQQLKRHFFLKYPGQPDSIKVLTSKLTESNNVTENFDVENYAILHERKRRSTKEIKKTVEIGVFFDEAAYRIFSPYFQHDDKKLRDMILAYINGVQSLYHHPSLGLPIDLTIVYIEIMKRQPADMPHYNGERSRLLDSFCDYQKRINPKDDKDPGHWDMGLYISGLDFYAYESGRQNSVTMGLATVGGVCIDQYACIIAEFGTTNIFGKPYPSAGFTSVYIMAHEIGHNLGMHHDSTGNSCPSEGYVMSPSRGTQGETTWSTCSADIVRDLNWATCLNDKPPSVPIDSNSWKYEGFPGQFWTAKQQCEILLTDKDAIASATNGLQSICQNLQCRTPHRSGYYFAGPALQGTECAAGKWCEGGYCVKQKLLAKPIEYVKGGWGSWKSEKCKTGCVLESRGYQQRERRCDNPVPVNTDEGCEGAAYDVVLCDDYRTCRKSQRKTAIEYASTKCKEFAKRLPELDEMGLGLQAPHELNRLWMACAIFCKRKDSGAYYTPRLDLNDLGIDPYFPDGTWCHKDETQNFYCLQHHCLPENFKLTKHTSIWNLGEDVPIAGNAPPNIRPINNKLLEYLSVDEHGTALRNELTENDVGGDLVDWTIKDYVELPKQRVSYS